MKRSERIYRSEHWSTIKQDVRYAVRQLRRSPGFSAVVIATLAVGIGGATAMFSVLHAVVLTPLPYAQPGQLVRLYQQEPENPATRGGVSATHFRTLRDQAGSFVDVAARYFREDLGLDITSGRPPQRLRVLLVTSDYFRTLRAEPFRGPGLQIKDEAGPPGVCSRRGCPHGVPRAWRRESRCRIATDSSDRLGN